jgi:hypothetical protein
VQYLLGIGIEGQPQNKVRLTKLPWAATAVLALIAVVTSFLCASASKSALSMPTETGQFAALLNRR